MKKRLKYFLLLLKIPVAFRENDGLDLPELFEKLRLTENGQLKRAAIILFGKDPGKFYPGIYVKIGRFGKDDTDIIFQETEEGNLILLLQAVLNQLNHKFLIRSIGFKGMHRIEKGEYPLAAIREMLLNALVHRNVKERRTPSCISRMNKIVLLSKHAMSVKLDATPAMFDKILQWQQSGLTQKAFCEQQGIAYHVFHYYYKRFRDKENIGSHKFIKLHVTPGNVLTNMELVYPDGKRLLFHQDVSVDFLKALIN
jgi:hypothetical protein